MMRDDELNCILHDCFFAVGQAVGTSGQVTIEAMAWLRQHYHACFAHALTSLGNSWALDRERVVALGRLLGERALLHAGAAAIVDRAAAVRAAEDVERGCRMNARREADGRLRPRHERGRAPASARRTH